MNAPETFAGRNLRIIAARIEARAKGTFQQTSAQLDAAELREVADRLDEAARPRSRREMEGDAKRAAHAGLWGAFCRIWSRAA